MTARTLMIQGSSSSAGKSLLVAALCRIFVRRGVRVAPFKAQNMSNNAAVCADGSEIGRAQALQAAAARLEPSADMNPVLIKPEADSRSQVILMGRPWKTLEARTYYEKKAILWQQVTASLDRLRAAHELIVIEGAGSPAELNLRARDIVNMAVAHYAHSPVLLVGDIDCGGIFAQLLGTLWLLEPEERTLVRGFVVNRFRGDLSLFRDGVQILEQKAGIPVLGVIPYIRELYLPDEDAVSVEVAVHAARPAPASQMDIAILALPRIANFDDFDSLRAEPGVHIRHIESADQLGKPHAVILPGTKSTMADLDWLHHTGLVEAVKRFAQDGGEVVGICGGYQMLGQAIHDPQHVESRKDLAEGLGLLPVVTTFGAQKATYRIRARTLPSSPAPSPPGEGGLEIEGYEIHMGETKSQTPWVEITHRNGTPVKILDGSVSSTGRVWGCYLHGLFHNDSFRHAWLGRLGWQGVSVSQSSRFEESLERLADVVEGTLNMDLLERIVWEN